MEKNKELARIFDRIADFLEFKGDSIYRVNAYRKAARVIKDLPEGIEELHSKGKLSSIPGIGEKLSNKIGQYLEKGTVKKYKELRREIPEELMILMDVPNLGPKTLRLAYERLGVRSLNDMKKVIKEGTLAQLPGMGPKKVNKIEKGLEIFLKGRDRMLLGEAIHIGERVLSCLAPHASKLSLAGSLRRMKETIGDLDILAVGGKGIMEAFVQIPGTKEVLAKGETKVSIILEETQIDLRVIQEEEWGTALQYFTGSKEHNVHLREIARDKGLKINEYGIFTMEKGERLGGAQEEDVYRALNLAYIPPELREDRGEIEAARECTLPTLVGYHQIQGDLHVHSQWSDGTATLEEISLEGRKLGYQYIAITDHSKSMKIAHGLDEKRLENQIKTIRDINTQGKGAYLVAGIEMDIHPDGTLDLDPEILKELDWVVASVHSHLTRDATERILAACHSPWVHCIGHPTGRIIFSREPYPLDLEKVLRRAASTGTVLEINAHQDRLDLKDIHCRKAKEMGIKVAIGTDSHHIGQLWMIRLGIGIARRGWLEAADVINTYPLKDFLAFTREKGKGVSHASNL
jgi:DNA polymerase (family 10)